MWVVLGGRCCRTGAERRGGRRLLVRLGSARGCSADGRLNTLAGALQAGDNLGPALELAATSVRRRNTDRRVTDWEMIDGDGAYPVR